MGAVKGTVKEGTKTFNFSEISSGAHRGIEVTNRGPGRRTQPLPTISTASVRTTSRTTFTTCPCTTRTRQVCTRVSGQRSQRSG
jgi:hypothetical protein